jgi:hypothetical protein
MDRVLNHAKSLQFVAPGVGSAAILHDDAIFTDVDALCTTCPAWLLGTSCTVPSHI